MEARWKACQRTHKDELSLIFLSFFAPCYVVHSREMHSLTYTWKPTPTFPFVCVLSFFFTEKQLLEAIAFYIQSVKPELIPKPPFDTARTTTEAEQATPSKQPLTTKTKSGSGTKKGGGGKKDKAQTTQPHLRRALPSPPEPIPPFASRVSAYSPASTTGMFIDTLRAGMSAAAAENAAAPPGMSGKGKRKVVRVRG